MAGPLQGKNIVLGVTGSIACYKAAGLASTLVQEGALVDVIMTEGATEFLKPLVFQSLTHRHVYTGLFETGSELSINHVALAERADVVVVAPATANTIAKISWGLADNALTATVLATTAPVLLAPAMDANMYGNPATQENVVRLEARGYTLAGPAEGRLASGLVGKGRMVEPAELGGHIRALLGRTGDLAGRKLVVSAGGTREPIDPVRVVTNRSSGKMGYAIAEAARDRGADVVLVTSSDLPTPVGTTVRRVETVASMREAVLSACDGADAVIMAAAISDFRPAQVSGQKIKKGPGDGGLVLDMVKNEDFLLEVPDGVLRVGFAAESRDLVSNARKKLKGKGLTLIVANDITAPDAGFGVDTNRVVIVDREGAADELPLLPKYEVGHRILDRIVPLLG